MSAVAAADTNFADILILFFSHRGNRSQLQTTAGEINFASCVLVPLATAPSTPLSPFPPALRVTNDTPHHPSIDTHTHTDFFLHLVAEKVAAPA